MTTRRLIKRYINNDAFYFDKGKVDDYAVVFVTNEGEELWLKDEQYLTSLQHLANCCGISFIYNQFLTIYNLVIKNASLRNNLPEPNNDDFQKIDELAKQCVHIEKLLSLIKVEELYGVFYLTMIAEFHKENTKLFHRVKLLAVYQILFLHMTPHEASNFSRNKNWQQLDDLMKGYGI